MKLYKPSKIYIEQDAKDLPHAAEILSRLPGIPAEVVSDARELLKDFKKRPDPIGEGKRALLLRRDRGRSFKPFPEIKEYLACDYYTLHLAEGCDLECSYCILQTYLTNPLLTVYVNFEEMLANLESILRANAEQFFRIGTGQLADSLSLDHLTGFSKNLVPFFARQPNAVLELKTKSVNVGNLEGLEANGKTIISWSMNSEKIQREEEHKCAPLEERLKAAKQVISWGYRVGFHFDPIIDYAEWEQDYDKTIQMIFKNIPAEKIAWMSLGCLRFMPELKPIMQSRFPKSSLPLAEWTTGMDGKMRYFKPRRVEIYRKMVEKIRRHTPETALYLIMETAEVWHQVFGGEHTKTTICRLLDTAGQNQAV